MGALSENTLKLLNATLGPITPERLAAILYQFSLDLDTAGTTTTTLELGSYYKYDGEAGNIKIGAYEREGVQNLLLYNNTEDGKAIVWLANDNADGQAFQILNSDSSTVFSVGSGGATEIITKTTSTSSALDIKHYSQQGVTPVNCFVIHNYTDGAAGTLDNVGSGDILLLRNAANGTTRPGVTGNGCFLHLADTVKNSWFKIFGTNREWTWLTEQAKLSSNRADDGNAAFLIRTYIDTAIHTVFQSNSGTLLEIRKKKVTIGTSVSSLTSSGTTATLVFTAAHGLTTGDYLEIAGAAETAYNGFFAITVSNATTVTYTMLSDPANTATGTITAKIYQAWWYTSTNVRGGIYIEAGAGDITLRADNVVLYPDSGKFVRIQATGGTGDVTPTKYIDIMVGTDVARIAYEVVT